MAPGSVGVDIYFLSLFQLAEQLSTAGCWEILSGGRRASSQGMPQGWAGPVPPLLLPSATMSRRPNVSVRLCVPAVTSLSAAVRTGRGTGKATPATTGACHRLLSPQRPGDWLRCFLPRPGASCGNDPLPSPASCRGENFSRCRPPPPPSLDGADEPRLPEHPRVRASPLPLDPSGGGKNKYPRIPEIKCFLLGRQIQNCKRMFCATPLRRLLQGGGSVGGGGMNSAGKKSWGGKTQALLGSKSRHLYSWSDCPVKNRDCIKQQEPQPVGRNPSPHLLPPLQCV